MNDISKPIALWQYMKWDKLMCDVMFFFFFPRHESMPVFLLGLEDLLAVRKVYCRIFGKCEVGNLKFSE